jgi:hypothetical protein
MEYAGVVMPVNAALVLQRVHELAASGTLTTSIRVESFQLKHPENLGPDLADVFGVEVQVRRGAQTPISAFLTRDEPDKSVPLAFTIADLVSGATPDAPQFDWRRRNMTPKGNGPFSAWERVVGKELFVTPVAADTPLGQP